MSELKTRYDIDFQNGRVERDWLALEKEFPERVAECKEFLENNPEDRRKALGILKKLQGRFKGTLQYDITKDDARVWYRVDRKEKLVIIKYSGHHPDKY
ncbi:type II toxin-antitoxin system RelE/ParE family toxin [Chloroflexota bacterium]